MDELARRCLYLLEQDDDSARVAGLLVLAHTMAKADAADPLHESLLLAAVDTVGLRFIARMLCPPLRHGSAPEPIASVAALILARLAALDATPAWVFHPVLITRLVACRAAAEPSSVDGESEAGNVTEDGADAALADGGDVAELDAALMALATRPDAAPAVADALAGWFAESQLAPASRLRVLELWDALVTLPVPGLEARVLAMCGAQMAAMMRSRLNASIRARLYSFGLWMLGSRTAVAAVAAKSWLVLAKGVCIDVRVVLESENLARGSAEVASLPRALLIAEELIRLLVSDDDGGIGGEAASKMIMVLMECLSAVTYYISAVANQGQANHDLMFPAVRVLGAWCAEENSLLTDQVLPLLPTLFDPRLRRAAAAAHGGMDWVVFLLPGLRAMLANPDVAGAAAAELVDVGAVSHLLDLVTALGDDAPGARDNAYLLLAELLLVGSEAGAAAARQLAAADPGTRIHMACTASQSSAAATAAAVAMAAACPAEELEPGVLAAARTLARSDPELAHVLAAWKRARR
ncbi:uncharacterized protein AMSG_01880 [Thecamonas trahens ATCC 50062]|uniref:Neurochondrin family protein n=1 Tax=Thecamonas trahens ATCC 50062 TaxID=461836 RepID=A0A0L0DUA1_THETB|nr:hypothetical protein AMSG_01880 [Thecamonas trahens ATCC 50062]KNC55611.1 hypothetical protein AMSG_01880 [Thecamonas trahens ATCC 50062]|eukprot:XP_013761384.1 hypothetical protein AMSG_01880 [Thecamonas trahens ATCC 50062]